MPLPAVDGVCVECGFDYEAVGSEDVAERLRTFGSDYGGVLAGVAEIRLRRRPEPQVWSALEYACHVRDVFRVQAARLQRVVLEQRPVLGSAGMWQWPERDSYNGQDVGVVLSEVLWLMRHTVHEGVHHLFDVARVLAA